MSLLKIPKFDHENIKKPFDGDLWNRQGIAERLEQYINRVKVGTTIAIDAEWGAGKTWFARHWCKQLGNNGFEVIYLDAFAQDYIDDPFLMISMEIANCLDKTANKDKIKDLKVTIGQVYRAVLPSVPMLLWSLTTTLMGAGLVAKPVADIVKALKDDSGDFGKELGNLLNEKLEEHLSAQVDNYENEKNSVEYFKATLKNITENLDKPLVFIIDELDRCKPEFAIRLIERIKHFFDIPNVAFVLSVNKHQLEQSINSYYGFKEGTNYLEKFIDLTVHLRSKHVNQSSYSNTLIVYGNDLGINMDMPSYHLACKVFKPNARQLIRIMNKFAFLKGGFIDGRSDLLFIVLIFIELNLIDKFDEPTFFKHFIKAHEYEFKDEMLEEYKHYGEEFSVFNFLNNRYRNFIPLFSYLEKTKDSEFASRSSGFKNSYLHQKDGDLNPDLIQTWYNYIHVVNG